MSLAAAVPTRTSRSIAPLLSIVGSAIVVGGFFYPSLFVMIAETCHPRYCHFGVIHGTVLSGWQILTIYAHPADPPFTRFIAYPYGLISLVPLAMGGIALLVGIGSLLHHPPRWLLLLTLGIIAVGLMFLLYDTVLLSNGVTGVIPGYIFVTATTPLALAGHALLYLGYLLSILGFVQMVRGRKGRFAV